MPQLQWFKDHSVKLYKIETHSHKEFLRRYTNPPLVTKVGEPTLTDKIGAKVKN